MHPFARSVLGIISIVAVFLLPSTPARGQAAKPPAIVKPPANARDAAPSAPAPRIATTTSRPATAPAAPAPAAAKVSMAAEIVAKIRAAKSIGYILIAMSIIGLGFALERLAHLRRKLFCPPGLADEVLEALLASDIARATTACDRHPSLLADVCRSIIKHRQFPFADIAAVAGDVADRELRQQMQKSYPMAVVATLAPLLGLLGTVIGMINSFEAVALAGAMGDPSVMAADISFALITTAMGLIVAAPNLALYHIFRMRTNNLATLLDEQTSELISELQLRRMAGRSVPGSAPAGGTEAVHA